MNAFPLVALCCASLASAQDPIRTKPGLTPMQMMSLRQVRSVVAADGAAAYVVSVPRPAADGPGGAYLHLYGYRPNQPPVLLSGGKQRVGNVEFRPGTDHVTFMRGGELMAVPVAGGDAVAVEGAPEGMRHAHWSPDGKQLAFTRLDPMSRQRAASEAKGIAVRVVDEDDRHQSLWLWDSESGEEKKLTEGRTVFHFTWRPDGQALALAMARRNLVDDFYMFQRLYLLDLSNSTLRKIVDNPGKLGATAFSPDGRRLAYVTGADRNDPHAGTLRVVTVATGERETRTWGYDGMVHALEWRDGGLLAGVSEGVRTAMIRFNSNGTVVRFALGSDRQPLAGRAFAMMDDTSAALVASTPQHPNELFIGTLPTWGTPAPDDDGPMNAPLRTRKITDHNPFLDDVGLGAQVAMEIEARDGTRIEGMLIYPLDHDPEQRYPLVVVVHGGPESHYSNGWLTRYSEWGQLLSARGYFAWYPNYRASTGRGVAFAKANHGDVMGGEFHDHLDAIAHFDAKGLIDRDRVGIGGGSYGGYTAAWAATRHSDHFAAAVSFVPFVHIPTKWMTSDIPWEFYLVHYEETWPWKQREYMEQRSPLTWAENCRTPLLLLGGDQDTRVHPSQPFMLYRAVKFATDTPTRYVQYPGEGHGNRSNVYQYDYCVRALRWFDHYLAGPDRRSAKPPIRDLSHGSWR